MTDYVSREQDRINAIFNDSPVKFAFQSQTLEDIPTGNNIKTFENTFDTELFGVYNVQANAFAGSYVRSYSNIINLWSETFGIDPNIAKEILYTETARGALYGLPAEMLGLADTILPGNISLSTWAGLIPGADFANPADNIMVAVKIMAEIAERLDDPSIENVYSLYNSLKHDRTYVNAETKLTPYFAKRAMEDHAWESEEWHLEGGVYSNCFPAGTPILMADGSEAPIETIRVGDMVMAFDGGADRGRGALMPRRVTRLFENVTDEWLQLRPADGPAAFANVIVTPGHHVLGEDGFFAPVDATLDRGMRLVLASGGLVPVIMERIRYEADTAKRFAEAQILDYVSAGSAVSRRQSVGFAGRSMARAWLRRNTYAAHMPCG